jgi:hypothetical protein
MVFWPQDLSGRPHRPRRALTFALATTAVGRVWCGWACPQTIFVKWWPKIEYLIQGSAQQQRAHVPWTWSGSSISVKNAVFSLSPPWRRSFRVGRRPGRAGHHQRSPSRHRLTVCDDLFSGTFYAVFARFRELACILPARTTGYVGVDRRRTITVTADRPRGEPCGKLLHFGRCVGGRSAAGRLRGLPSMCDRLPDGHRCPQRSQLECVNCTAAWTRATT